MVIGILKIVAVIVACCLGLALLLLAVAVIDAALANERDEPGMD